jgi:hypothetical protein
LGLLRLVAPSKESCGSCAVKGAPMSTVKFCGSRAAGVCVSAGVCVCVGGGAQAGAGVGEAGGGGGWEVVVCSGPLCRGAGAQDPRARSQQ